MSKIVGIDLGTTYSLVAVVDSGIPLVIADADGQRLTPSVVNLPAAGAAPVVGRAANRLRALKPAETIYSVKRFIGRRGSEISQEEMLVTYPVAGSGARPVTMNVHGRAWTPEEISAEVLKKLKADAEVFLGGPVTRAVITVPAYFNDAQRTATKRAGEMAGFTVERIINEPTAAALAYGLDRLKERSRVAVYDLGGGTFDLSILELRDGVFQVLATHGNTRLGGDDLDRRIVEWLLGKIREVGGPLTPALSPSEGEREQRPISHPGPLPQSQLEIGNLQLKICNSPNSLTPALSPSEGDREKDGAAVEQANALAFLARVREAAEQAKIKLSTETEVEIALPFLTADFSFQCTLARDELERLTGDLIHRTREHCLRSLADAKLDPKDLDQIILVGGQTRMPLVRRLVGEWFGCAEFEEARGAVRLGTGFHRAAGPQLNTSQNPDEAVALGAAIQAEILSGGFKNLLLLDVTPLSLGIETFGGLMNVIIPRNTTIPVKAGEAFTTAVDFQREMLIHVLQGERERAKDNWSLGRFTLEFQPAPRGVPRVGVQFEIDANGILRVLARDIHTGKEKIVQMKSAVDVEDAAVQKMVEESVEHFFEDTRARQWIEGKLKANDTAAATRHGLAECGAELEAANRRQIERALAALDSVLAAEDPATKTGDPKALQEAAQALDEATRPLAELLMDRAMDALLRKRGAIR